MNWVRDIDSLIGYVVLRAPDRFQTEDYLSADEQMNLERAFVELRRGIDLVAADGFSTQKQALVGSLLERSLFAYRAGEEVKGAHLLQDFQNQVFKQEEQ